MKQVSFDQTCQLIPDTDCKQLRKLLALTSRQVSVSSQTAFDKITYSKSNRSEVTSTRIEHSGIRSRPEDTAVGSASSAFDSLSNRHNAAQCGAGVSSSSAVSSPRRSASTSQTLNVYVDEVEKYYRNAGYSPLKLANEDPGLARIRPAKRNSVVSSAVRRSSSLSVSSCPVPRKSCLLQPQTPLSGTGTQSDVDRQKQTRRRSMGPPIIARPSYGKADVHLLASSIGEKLSTGRKTSGTKWNKFRRAASEGPSHVETSTLRSLIQQTPLNIAEANRELLAGRWPFELPLKTDCSCKGCHTIIELGLTDGYRPPWTKAARIKWLEAQEDSKANESANVGLGLMWRATSRSSIQADEVDKLRGESITPMTAAELEAETASPLAEVQVQPLPSSCDSAHTDDVLRQEIVAKRNLAKLNTSCRPGARSMMRQLEEAERKESEAAQARSRSRDGSQPPTPSLVLPSPSTITSSPPTPLNEPSYFDIPVRPHSADPVNMRPRRTKRGSQGSSSKSPFSMSTLLRALGPDSKSPSASSPSRFSSMFR